MLQSKQAATGARPVRGGVADEADNDLILALNQGPVMDNRSDIWRGVDAIKGRFIALSDTVWATPEVCYTEARSSAEHLRPAAPPGLSASRRTSRAFPRP